MYQDRSTDCPRSEHHCGSTPGSRLAIYNNLRGGNLMLSNNQTSVLHDSSQFATTPPPKHHTPLHCTISHRTTRGRELVRSMSDRHESELLTGGASITLVHARCDIGAGSCSVSSFCLSSTGSSVGSESRLCTPSTAVHK